MHWEKCFIGLIAATLLVGCSAEVTDEGPASDPAKDSSIPATGTAANESGISELRIEAPIYAKVAALPQVFQDDLKYTPPSAYLVAVMRPARMIELEGVRHIPGADWGGANPVKPSEVKRALVTVFPSATYDLDDLQGKLSLGFVLQLNKAISRETIISWLSPDAQPLDLEPKVYADRDWNRGSLALGFPDNRTVLASSDINFVFRQTRHSAQSEGKSKALVSGFSKLDPNVHALAVVDANRLKHFMHTMPNQDVATWSKLFESFPSADSLQLSVDLAGSDGFLLRAEADSAQDVERRGKDAFDALSALVTTTLTGFQNTLGERFTDRVVSVRKRMKTLLDSTEVRHHKNSYVIASPRLPTAGRSLQLITEFIALHLATLRQQQDALRFIINLKHLSLAMHNHTDARLRLPRDYVSADGKPLLSWRVAVLPFAEEDGLFSRFHLDEPWDSEHNLKLLNEMPRVFQSREPGQANKTSIRLVTGAGTTGSVTRREQIKAPGHTLALIESNELVEWTRPGNFVFDQQDPGKGLRRPTSHGVTWEGATVELTTKLDEDLLRAAFLNDGKEIDLGQITYKNTSPPRHESSLAPVPLTDARVAEFVASLQARETADLVKALTLIRKHRRSLFDQRAQPVADQVVELLASESAEVRTHALQAILSLNHTWRLDWRVIARLLNDPYESNRWFALQILSEFAEPELVRAMMRLPLQDGVVVSRVLFDDYAPIAAESVVPLLKDADFRIRAKACSLLGALGNQGHVAQLQPLLDDDHKSCRESAKSAIDQLQQKGPLEAAMEQSFGDIVVVLKKMAKQARTDDHNDIIKLNLEYFNTPRRLVAGDFRLLSKLRKLRDLRLTAADISAEGVSHLEGLPLENLSIDYCPLIDDRVARSIGTLTKLKILDLDGTKVADETAKAIGNMKQLQTLGLSRTWVTDLGLSHLDKLPQLERLDLSESRVGDQGLAALAGLDQLKELYLMKTQVTDAGVKHLVKLKNLSFLNLSGTGVTAEGIARLHEALPNCRVEEGSPY